MNLLILWSPLADYTLECFTNLARKDGLNIYIVYQGIGEDAPFDKFDFSAFRWAKRFTEEKQEEIRADCMAVRPDFILMASWNYNFYMKISRECKKNGTYVLAAFDGQWEPTMKQRFGVIASPFILKPAIDNFFVPGDRQAKLARELGYEAPLTGYYSANTNRFVSETRTEVRRKFIFVGRLIELKGIRELAEAYKSYRQKTEDPWDLIIAGTGPLRPMLENIAGVSLRGFVQPPELPALMKEAGCLVLPSHKEPWGVVVHEASISGLIILASYKVGASTWFLRDGVNGRLLTNEVASIENGLSQISGYTDTKLLDMSKNSQILGSLWSTSKWADYLYDFIYSQYKISRNINPVQKVKVTD